MISFIYLSSRIPLISNQTHIQASIILNRISISDFVCAIEQCRQKRDVYFDIFNVSTWSFAVFYRLYEVLYWSLRTLSPFTKNKFKLRKWNSMNSNVYTPQSLRLLFCLGRASTHIWLNIVWYLEYQNDSVSRWLHSFDNPKDEDG